MTDVRGAGAGQTPVDFGNVDIIFGKEPQQALALLDQGATRDEILAQTNNVVGVAGASLAIEEGEICVLMGLSGSGKSTLLRAVNGLNKVTRGKVLVRDETGLVDVASCDAATLRRLRMNRSEEHTSELQSLMRISYAVFCLKKKKDKLYNAVIIYSTHRTSYPPF